MYVCMYIHNINHVAFNICRSFTPFILFHLQKMLTILRHIYNYVSVDSYYNHEHMKLYLNYIYNNYYNFIDSQNLKK